MTATCKHKQPTTPRSQPEPATIDDSVAETRPSARAGRPERVATGRADALPSPQRAAWAVRHRVETPLGAMTAVATAAGLAGLWFDGQAHHPGDLSHLPADPALPLFKALEAQLTRYWASAAGAGSPGTAVDGSGTEFDVPLDPVGTDFQRRVWDALRRIPRGATTRYGDIAAQLGQPSASRAVGAAVGRNPLSILVPCHRVIGRDGSLTGYAGGLDRKTALLRLEGALPETLI